MRSAVIVFLLVLAWGCKKDSNLIDPPIQVVSGQSALVNTEYGLVLSWQEAHDGDIQLRMSTYNGTEWSTPNIIAKGDNWFVNWADFPAIVANGDNLFAHFLQMAGETTYDYDIMFTLSADRGSTWSMPQKLHSDSISAEHGFVSAIPFDDGFYVSWLDGRNTKKEDGAMSLRAAYLDMNGGINYEAEIDHKTCDCCQTAMANVQGTPYVTYRDRSDAEVRDIYYAKSLENKWQEPVNLNKDNWEINGCPVNGPTITSDDQNMAIAWFTGANGVMNVNLIVSNDAGANFGEAILVSGPDALGRVDIEMVDGIIYLTYMTNVDNITQIMLSQFEYSGNLISTEVLTTVSSDRGTGFPRSAIWDNNLVVTWTDTKENKVRVLQYPLESNLTASHTKQ